MIEQLEYPFDSGELLQRKKSIKRELLKEENFMDKRVAILCGGTVGEMKHMLELFLLGHGIRPTFFEGQYNRFYEEAVYETEELVKFAPDIVYIHTSVINLYGFLEPGASIEEVEEAVEGEFSKFRQVWDKLLWEVKCPVIQNNFEQLPYRLLGNKDVYSPSGKLYYIRKFNDKLYAYAMENKNFYINDLAYEASSYGLERWFDEGMYYMYKYPFAVDAIPGVAFNIANIVKSIYGKNKKAVVLDLDNTLWGGVIGDDGVENLELGVDTPSGMAFSSFQKYIKDLSKIGITLNVCSKNDENIAKTGFSHRESVLQLDDFISFKANWNDKDKNIKEIMEELRVGENAIVFLDDNPAEREFVKKAIPDIQAPNLSSPESYVRTLDKGGFFEVTVLSSDDIERKEYYITNKKREEYWTSFTDYKEYLKSMEMVCLIEKFHNENIQRITQLINKTNQFNLTTKRYTQEQVQNFSEKEENITFCSHLSDKFGKNGIVSVMMVHVCKEIAFIDLWVMSCRVLKRDLELAMFDFLVKECIKRKIKMIQGVYYKTKKNAFVENLYKDLGFQLMTKDDGNSTWEYKVFPNYEEKNQVMEMRKT